jgi:hypothetical protein
VIFAGDLDAVVAAKFNGCRSHALVNRDTGTLSVSKKYLIKLRTLDLKGSRRRWVKRVGEIRDNISVPAGQGEISASLDHADAVNLIHHPKIVEDREVTWQERFPNVESRMKILLEKGYAPTAATKKC